MCKFEHYEVGPIAPWPQIPKGGFFANLLKKLKHTPFSILEFNNWEWHEKLKMMHDQKRGQLHLPFDDVALFHNTETRSGRPTHFEVQFG